MSLANLKAEYFVGIVNMSDTSVQYVCTQRQTIPQVLCLCYYLSIVIVYDVSISKPFRKKTDCITM